MNGITNNQMIQQKKVMTWNYMKIEGDEKVKEGKGLKIFTPNKLLTRLPVLLY